MPALNVGSASRTVGLEWLCRGRNEWCSGEMLRDHSEHRLRRHLANPLLTLRHESVGIEQD